MDTLYRFLLKPFLFALSPERAHRLTLILFETALRIPILSAWVKAVFKLEDPRLEREVFGLRFRNPIGLAAGFDKNGAHIHTMAQLGFGFLEVGTVTPKGQEGNPAPRLFRLPQDKALINRMGFNNEGLDTLVRQLQKPRPAGILIGGNIGKNKITPNEEATADYVACFEAIFPYVDYFVVNVSSPNTPGLRELQEKEPLQALLQKLQDLNREKPTPKPILLKIAPDLSDTQLDDIVAIVLETRLAGIIATNTTISREGLQTSSAEVEAIGAGGLSGRPLRQRATEVIWYLHQRLGKDVPIIGVGGIGSAGDALEKLQAGASLIQVYSSLVYEGPTLIRKIKEGILTHA
ncbi:MAG: quinone-dependent dihydroorotate dehydrogenase [Saprospirales bacterium]|nr:quinone-dependent dihydroorotate dehydrogenase [Saprospirales bacterium]